MKRGRERGRGREGGREELACICECSPGFEFNSTLSICTGEFGGVEGSRGMGEGGREWREGGREGGRGREGGKNLRVYVSAVLDLSLTPR